MRGPSTFSIPLLQTPYGADPKSRALRKLEKGDLTTVDHQGKRTLVTQGHAKDSQHAPRGRSNGAVTHGDFHARNVLSFAQR